MNKISLSRFSRFFGKIDGFSIVSTMIALGIGVFMMLGLTQLLQLSRQQLKSIDNTARMYETARYATNYFISQVGRAGYGMVQPDSNPPQGFSAGGVAGTTPYVTFSQYVPGEAYMGCYTNLPTSASTPSAPVLVDWTDGNGWGATDNANCVQTLMWGSFYNYNFTSWVPLMRFSAMRNTGTLCVFNYYTANHTTTRSAFLSNATTTGAVCSQTCSGNATYNCGGINASGSPLAQGSSILPYEMVYFPVVAFSGGGGGVSSAGATNDPLTIFLSNQNTGYTIPDCTNGTILANSSSTTEIGQPAACAFNIGLYDSTDTTCTPQSATCNYQLNAISRTINYGASSTDSTQTSSNPVTGVIEFMKVVLGEDDYGQRDPSTPSLKATSVSRWVNPPAYAAQGAYPSSSLIDLTNVVAVRIAFVVRSDEPILSVLPTVATPLNLMRGTGGTMLTYTPPIDQYMRKVFVITVPFTNFIHRNYPNNNAFSNTVTNANVTQGVDYERHCVANGGNYSIKVGGVRTHAITSGSGDRCCSTNGTSCVTYSALGTVLGCETGRVSSSYGGNCAYFYQVP